MDTQVLTVSTKGQIALPAGMRKQLSISAGDKLVAYTNGDSIILKLISLPAAQELEALMDQELKDRYEMTDDEIMVGKFVKEFRRNRREQV